MTRLTLLDLRDDDRDPRGLIPRPHEQMAEAYDTVTAIIDDVSMRGDAAVRDYTKQFDHVVRDELAVDAPTRAAALKNLDPELRSAIERAIDQVRWFHERARPQDWQEDRDGALMGQWHRPVQRVGVYVPGGKAAYPSTVVMTVVPAQVAGVEQIVLCSPPGADTGEPDTTVLAVAEMLGVDVVIAAGGAQAIAAMAFGTQTIPACDKVVGPGNAYVAAAKQQVQARGVCGIDAFAGPTEIAIVADATADGRIVAADLIAQAEHDELAGVLLITPSVELVDEVEAALEQEILHATHRDRIEAALAGQGTAVIVSDIDHAVAVAEAYAAEHLEVHTVDAADVAGRIRYAGTTFIGTHTPVSLGDYAAGPNHTLPVQGTARFAGGLTTASYMVTVNHVTYTPEALADLAGSVQRLAAAENLPAHWRAVDVRLNGAT